MSPFDENKQFWVEFIELYRSHECLWNTRCKDYLNNDVRFLAYESLVEKCREIDVDADKGFVVKRINSLRASFRRQYRKVHKPRESDDGESKPREPTLWYYDLLMFTVNPHRRPGSRCLVKNDASNEQPVSENSVSNLEIEENNETDETYIPGLLPTVESKHQKASRRQALVSSLRIRQKIARSKMRLSVDPKTVWAKKRNQLAEIVTRYINENNTANPENVVFGRNVGLQLDSIEDIEQKDIAQKLISDALFYAKRGKLNIDAYIQPNPNATYVSNTIGQNDDSQYE